MSGEKEFRSTANSPNKFFIETTPDEQKIDGMSCQNDAYLLSKWENVQEKTRFSIKQCLKLDRTMIGMRLETPKTWNTLFQHAKLGYPTYMHVVHMHRDRNFLGVYSSVK